MIEPQEAGTAYLVITENSIETKIILNEKVYVVKYTLTDGELGDDDTIVGSITDPIGAGQIVAGGGAGAGAGGGGAGAGSATSIPTLSEWGQYLLILMLAVVGARRWQTKESGV